MPETTEERPVTRAPGPVSPELEIISLERYGNWQIGKKNALANNISYIVEMRTVHLLTDARHGITGDDGDQFWELVSYLLWV